MMGSNLQICILSSIFLAFILARTAATTPFFIFGDSILDAGNNNNINTTTLAQSNFWPYGITFFHHPTGRFSDGRLICDFIAEHANLPLIPPFLQQGKPRLHVNFASAGAGALVQTSQGLVIDLHMQLRNYKRVKKWFNEKFGDTEAKRRFSRAVYLFSIGSNDYTSLLTSNSTNSESEFVGMVISNITSVITEIYKTGGRKFAFLNLPPFDCFPFLRNLNTEGNDNCLKEVSSYPILHNQALFQVLNKLERQLPGFKYSLYDLYTSLQLRIDQPWKYGYKEGKTACCGTGKFRGIFSCGGKRPVKEFELCENVNDYVFWDSAHLTEKAYRQLAHEMWSNTNNTLSYGSYSIKDLFHLP